MKVEVKDLNFSYGNVPVLQDINLVLDKPGLVCIVGPNGVGKSTLVKCILGLNKITSGEVLLDGLDASRFKLKDKAKVMGFVPVTANETFSMSVLDLVMMGRHPHQKMGNATELDRKIVKRALNMMGIKHLALKESNELSAGQGQKVAIAKGLAQAPKILILDEPTSNLDVRHQLQVTELLMKLAHTTGMTILMVSHDLNVSAKYADEIIMMSPPGVVYKTGSPSEVMTEENIRHIYGVESQIIDDDGRPHVILKKAVDPERDEI